MNNKRICVGCIYKVHGIQGAVRIKTYTDSLESFLVYDKFFTNVGDEICLVNPKPDYSKNDIITRIKGYSDRTAVSCLCKAEIFINRDSLPKAEKDEYYFEDLKGLVVKDTDGLVLGIVKNVCDYGAGAFLEILLNDCEEKKTEATIQFDKKAVIEVLLKDGYITVDKKYMLF